MRLLSLGAAIFVSISVIIIQAGEAQMHYCMTMTNADRQ